MTIARAAAFRVSFPLYDSTTGLLKTGSSPAGTVSLDGGNFAAVTDAPLEIQTSGVYELTLTAAEMTADLVTVKVTAAGALAVTLHIQTDTVAAAIATVDDYVDTEVAAILAAVDTEVAAIKAVTDALPNAGALTTIQADLDDLQTRVPAALVGGRMDASVGAMTAGVVTAAAVATGAIDADALAADAVTEIAAGITIPSAAAIADQVWDEAIAAHLGVGSTGEALNAAGGAGDPWITALPGAYGAGTAGKIVGDNLNAPVADVPTAIENADALLSRPISSIEGGVHPFRSLYGLIAKLVNKTSIAGNTLTITETDDVTSLATQTLTRDASAEPVVGVDTN